MDRQAAFVHNVMIGREGLTRRVLLGLFAEAGANAPRSYISTGNVTFGAHSEDVGAITTSVEAGIGAVLGRPEPVFVRSVEYLQELVAANPFLATPFPDPIERTVSFLSVPINLDRLELPVMSRRGDVALFAATSGEVFAVGRVVDGKTGGGGGLVEKTVGRRVTTRSWNTVLRITNDPV